LIVIWAVGILKLFTSAKPFEIMVDLTILILVLAFAVILTKIKPADE
jgi:hypothetical protein